MSCVCIEGLSDANVQKHRSSSILELRLWLQRDAEPPLSTLSSGSVAYVIFAVNFVAAIAAAIAPS